MFICMRDETLAVEMVRSRCSTRLDGFSGWEKGPQVYTDVGSSMPVTVRANHDVQLEKGSFLCGAAAGIMIKEVSTFYRSRVRKSRHLQVPTLRCKDATIRRLE